jgi:hypothetical protein
MSSQIDVKQIDGATSTAVRRAIGERLRQSLNSDISFLPVRLQKLLDELRQQDDRAASSSH